MPSSKRQKCYKMFIMPCHSMLSSDAPCIYPIRPSKQRPLLLPAMNFPPRTSAQRRPPSRPKPPRDCRVCVDKFLGSQDSSPLQSRCMLPTCALPLLQLWIRLHCAVAKDHAHLLRRLRLRAEPRGRRLVEGLGGRWVLECRRRDAARRRFEELL